MTLWRRQWHPTPVLLPGKSHGWRSLVGCSPWGLEESDTTEQLHFHFSLSCTEEGNGNPLRCSCLENPRGSGTWWAAVYGVTQSRTWLKQLSNSSSMTQELKWFSKWLKKSFCSGLLGHLSIQQNFIAQYIFNGNKNKIIATEQVFGIGWYIINIFLSHSIKLMWL